MFKMLKFFEQKPSPSTLEKVMGYFLNPIFLLVPGTILLMGILIAYMEINRRHAVDEAARVGYALSMLNLDMTQAELAEYNGKAHAGRTLVAVNGDIYDITASPSSASMRLSGRSLVYRTGTEGWSLAKQLGEQFYKVGRLKDYMTTKTQQSKHDDRMFEKLVSRKLENNHLRSRSGAGHSRSDSVPNVSDEEESN